MTLQRSKVLHANRPSRETFSKALSVDWNRCFPLEARGTAAEILGCNKKTIGNAIGGIHNPDSYTLVMSLLADQTALQGILGLVGMKAIPLKAEAANDLQTVSALSHLSGQWTEALSDGVRDHNETVALADKIIALVPQLMALVSESQELRGVG